MFLKILFGSPALALAWMVAIFTSLTVHEFSHALAGKIKGDLTAEREGRLTLNPVAHIDLMGLIPLFIFGFGWAKPVPFNPYNLKNPKWDSVYIALAGPLSNLILAIISGVAFRVLISSGTVAPNNLLAAFLFLMILINLFLMFFNIVPIHPLDGSKLFFALFDHPKYAQVRQFVAVRGPQILMFAIFIAILTNIDVFFFISAPSYATCDAILGANCSGYLFTLFSSI
jgi:Zn-dependent protease